MYLDEVKCHVPTEVHSISDFVQVARNLFCLQLDEVNVSAREISSVLDSQVGVCLMEVS